MTFRKRIYWLVGAGAIMASVAAGGAPALGAMTSSGAPGQVVDGAELVDQASVSLGGASTGAQEVVDIQETADTEDDTAVGQASDGDEVEVQEPSDGGSITADDSVSDGLSEAEEAAVLQDRVTITAEEAKVAAEAANTGATALAVELDDENGVVVYSVELSGGLEVKVDAGNGNILRVEHSDEN